MNLAQAVGKRIRQLIESKNITQYRLAKITCLSQNGLSNLLNGKTKDVKFSTIYLTCQFLNVSLEEFVSSPLFTPENIEI